MKAPCKDCPDRAIRCHSSCPRYSNFAKYRERIRQKRYEEFYLSEATEKIQKNNQARKDAARDIVYTAAAADGIKMREIEKQIADDCIEANVHELPRNQ